MKRILDSLIIALAMGPAVGHGPIASPHSALMIPAAAAQPSKPDTGPGPSAPQADAPAPAKPPPAEELFQLPEVKKKLEPVPEGLLQPVSPADPDEPVIVLSEEVLESYVTFFPGRSTLIGVGSYEQMLGNYKKSAIGGFLGSCKGYLTRLDALSPDSLTEKGRVERDALRVHVRALIRLLESTSAPTRDPNFYVDESVGAIQALVDRDTSGELTRAEHLLARMSILKPFYATARENLGICSKPAVRRAIVRLRASEALFANTVAVALRQSGHPQASVTGPQLIASAQKQVSDFAAWLEKEKLPQAVKNEPLGEAGWREWLRSREDTDLSPQEVSAAVESDLAKLKQEFQATAAEISKSKPAEETLAEISRQRDEPASALRAAEDEIAELWQWMIRNQPAGVPSDDPIFTRETPAFRRREAPIRADLPGGYVRTPAVYLEISPPDPDWPTAIMGSWLSAYSKQFRPLALMREVYPGRFVAWQRMRKSKIRTCKAVEAPTMSEGWALYAEEIATRGGFRAGDPKLKLAMLTDLIRADATLIASIRVHVSRQSLPEAAGWLAKEAYWPQETAALEVERLLADPDKGAAALGRLAILKLLADLQKSKGAAFSSREFHSQFLSFGSAPVSAIRRALIPGASAPLLGPGK